MSDSGRPTDSPDPDWNPTPESSLEEWGRVEGSTRLDRAAIEAKWRAHWAKCPKVSPIEAFDCDEDLNADSVESSEGTRKSSPPTENSDSPDSPLQQTSPVETRQFSEDDPLASADWGSPKTPEEQGGEPSDVQSHIKASVKADPETAGDALEEKIDAPSSKKSQTSELDGGQRPFYCLDMFPYPSTHGFSVNQLRGISVTDVVARYQRARGRQVFRPLGWDSFGIGIEQEADELGVSPDEVVSRGIAVMKDQLERFGVLVDWDAELKTSDPSFYRWTQWLFLKMHQDGLAVRESTPMKWCESCRMNLANEEVEEGGCVHCGKPVTERSIPQWKVRITEFGDRLHQGLRSLKWPPQVKTLQRNWIGRREGYLVTLKARSEFQEESQEFQVFTRQLESISEAAFVVLAPEHPTIDLIVDSFYQEEVREYQELTKRLTDRHRLAAQGQPVGVPTGAWALNPVSLKPMQIWVSASVLPTIRDGAILAHPSLNPRLKAFADHFRIPQETSRNGLSARKKGRRAGRQRRGGSGTDGRATNEVRRQVRKSLEERGLLASRTDFHLRDWIFARQRYWGEPIPIVHCAQCGEVPVPEESLPVELPILDKVPEGVDGRSPLSAIDEFRETTCPQCGESAERETDTMPQWAASGWYYLRYLSPNDDQNLFRSPLGEDWLPVNLCVGGIEHSILHLLYVRFFSYFFHDLQMTQREEPFRRLFTQGRVRAPGDSSKSLSAHRGNRVLAEELLSRWGSDAMRLHLLFLGPPESDVEWNEKGLRGCCRFLKRAYDVVLERHGQGKFVSRRVLVLKHRLIRRVTRAIRTFHLNKSVAAFMEFVNELRSENLTSEEVDRDTLKTFLVLLHPFAPHLSSEIWQKIGETSSLEEESWPEYSEELLRPTEVEIVIMINNRIADRMTVDPTIGKTELLHEIERRPNVLARTGGRRADRVFVDPERLVHMTVSEDLSADSSQDDQSSAEDSGGTSEAQALSETDNTDSTESETS